MVANEDDKFNKRVDSAIKENEAVDKDPFGLSDADMKLAEGVPPRDERVPDGSDPTPPGPAALEPPPGLADPPGDNVTQLPRPDKCQNPSCDNYGGKLDKGVCKQCGFDASLAI